MGYPQKGMFIKPEFFRSLNQAQLQPWLARTISSTRGCLIFLYFISQSFSKSFFLQTLLCNWQHRLVWAWYLSWKQSRSEFLGTHYSPHRAQDSTCKHIVHLPSRCNGAIPSNGLQGTGLNCLIHAVKTKQWVSGKYPMRWLLSRLAHCS